MEPYEKKTSPLSHCEETVMKVLWDGQEMTVSEIIPPLCRLTGKEYVATTVYTFLARLRKKGYVSSRKKGASIFFPLVTEKDYVKGLAGDMAEFWGEKCYALFLEAYGRDLNAGKERLKS